MLIEIPVDLPTTATKIPTTVLVLSLEERAKKLYQTSKLDAQWLKGGNSN